MNALSASFLWRRHFTHSQAVASSKMNIPMLRPSRSFSPMKNKSTKMRPKARVALGVVRSRLRGFFLILPTAQLPQMDAFVKAAERGVLDDAMVTEFVRKLQVNEQWNKSTIAIQDKRAEDAKKRARAQAILEAKRARGDFDAKKEESSV